MSGGAIRQWRKGEPLLADLLNRRIVDVLIKVITGGKGILVRQHGPRIVIESTGAGKGGSGSNGVWV